VTHLHVIGTGLIGTSFALAARAGACFDRITGADADAARLERAVALGALEAGDPGGADAVLIAVPVGRVAEVVAEVAPRSPATVFDVASAKRRPIADVAAQLGRVPENFVPCHPMAGSEQSGPDAADAELFRARPVFVTPQAGTDPVHVERVARWWRACGAEVHETTAEHHDAAVALTSHLPHLLAAALVASIAERRLESVLQFAGAGFADFTRIAEGDASLWRDITESNRDAIAAHLDDYLERLVALRAELEEGTLDELQRMLTRARELKRAAGADRRA
jgi:prephenate dehydrogenase